MQIDAIRSAVDASKLINTWALSIIAGSFLVLLSTSYRQPKNRIKLFYFLFLPAWAGIGISIFKGYTIIGSGIMAELNKDNTDFLYRVILTVNQNYSIQSDCLMFSLACLGAWLVAYLLWFIFSKEKNENISS